MLSFPPAVEPVIKLLVGKVARKVAILSEPFTDILVLQQIEETEAVRIDQKLRVLRLLPILQVVQVADELAVEQVALQDAKSRGRQKLCSVCQNGTNGTGWRTSVASQSM